MNVSLIRVLSALFIIALAFYSLAGNHHKGAIIILNGTSAAGKTTLASQLIRDFPGKCVVVKKTTALHEKRIALIKKYTGKTAASKSQIAEALSTMPGEYRDEYQQISKDALNITIKQLKAKALEGNIVICDMHLDADNTKNLRKDFQVLSVLLYTPLPVLASRRISRSNDHKVDKKVQLHGLQSILSGFQNLYKPVLSGDQSAIDTLGRQEIFTAFAITEVELYPTYLTALDSTLKHFHLHLERNVAIAPKSKYNLIIRSDMTSVKESSKLVMRKLGVVNDGISNEDSKDL